MLPKNKYPRHGKFTEDKSGNNSEVTKSKVTVNTIISKLNTEYINIMRRRCQNIAIWMRGYCIIVIRYIFNLQNKLEFYGDLIQQSIIFYYRKALLTQDPKNIFLFARIRHREFEYQG